jgi:hypothetical protein
MATYDLSTRGNLKDILENIGPDGNYMTVAEILDRETAVLKDAPMREANDTTIHKYSVRNSLPGSSITRFNERRTGSKGSTKMEIAQIETRNNLYRIDKRLVDIATDASELLNDEAHAMIEGLGQDFDERVIYGEGGTGEILGIAPRLATLGDFVLSNATTVANEELTSMYIVGWDAARGCSMVYPKGSTGGIEFKDRGIVDSDTDDGFIQNQVTEVFVSGGFIVKDDRGLARIANVDVQDATLGETTFDENKVILLINRMPVHLRRRAIAYVSRNLHAAIEMRANDKDNAYYTAMNVFGEDITSIRGLPIRLDEKISEAEDRIA